MAETLATIKTRVSSLLQDQAGFITTTADGVMEFAIRDAIETFSIDVPYQLTADVAGDGATFDLTLPAGYLDGFSRFTSIEYPAGQREPLYLDSRDWSIYRTASSAKLRLFALIPNSGETVRLTYTAQHTLKDLDSAAATTIPAYYTQAFVNLCTAKCLLRLANRFLEEQESTLNVDSVDRGSKSDSARRLQKVFMDLYSAAVGVSGGEAPGTTAVIWHTSTAGSGVGRLTHRGRRP
jgi:hypothetical protein